MCNAYTYLHPEVSALSDNRLTYHESYNYSTSTSPKDAVPEWQRLQNKRDRLRKNQMQSASAGGRSASTFRSARPSSLHSR